MIKKISAGFLIAVILFSMFYYSIGRLWPEDKDSDNQIIYSTKEAFRGDINVGVNISGQLNASHGGAVMVPETTEPVLRGIGFSIEEFLVEQGDIVSRDLPVVRLSSIELEQKIEDLKNEIENKKEYMSKLLGVDAEQINNINPYDGIIIRSPIDGRVTELNAREGEELDSLIADVIDDSEFRVSFKSLQSEYASLWEGQRVLLSFPYFEGYYEGKIVNLNTNPVPDNSGEFGMNFVHWGEIEAENPGLVQKNMNVYISTAASEDSLKPKMTLENSGIVKGYINEKKIFKNAISTEELVVTEVLVNERDYVKSGQPIAKLAGTEVIAMIQEKMNDLNQSERILQKANELMENMLILSPMDGVVSGFWRQTGEVVRAGEPVGDIFNTASMRLWSQVDDVDVVHIRQDASVKVKVDALPGEEFEGVVRNISQYMSGPEGNINYSVEIEVKGSEGLRPGMMAQCYIDAGKAENTILVPIESVFEENGVSKVEILRDDGRTEAVQIETGLINNVYAEVKSGIEEGWKVVTGSTLDLLPSSKVEDKSSIIPGR